MENIFTEKYLQKVDSQTLLFVNVEKMSFSLENILNEADGHASIPRKSFLSLGSSVTKLLDYLLGHWKHWKTTQKHIIFAKVSSNCIQIYMNSFKKAKVLKVVPKGRNFAKSGHTVHRHMCKEKAHDFRPACYVDGVFSLFSQASWYDLGLGIGR